MRILVLISAMVFSLNSFAEQGVGSPTEDLNPNGGEKVHLNLSLKAAQKFDSAFGTAKNVVSSGFTAFKENPWAATKKAVLYVPKQVYNNVTEQNLVVEYRDSDYDNDNFRLLWNVQTGPMIDDKWGALEFTVKAEEGEGIDLSYAKATVANIMNSYGVDIEVMSYIYSKNQEMITDIGSTSQINLVSVSANDDDLLGLGWSVAGVDIALVASWEVAYAADADGFEIDSFRLTYNACAGASFSKWGWTATPEYCESQNDVYDFGTDSMQTTFQKNGSNWAVAVGSADNEVNGADAGSMNYIRIHKMLMPNKNTMTPVSDKK